MCSALALAACGGGGGDDGAVNNTTNTNKSPTNVVLSAVTPTSQTSVDVSWTAANDDTTPANQLTYEIHLTEGGDFTPSTSTLKFSGKNVLGTQVTGLKAATNYSVKLVAIDAQGLKTVSVVKFVTTQNAPAASLLNDTGITQCRNKNNVFGNCDEAHLSDWFAYRQDAQVGRDALAAKGQLTKVGGGDAGFDFTKISATGVKLPANATEWNCVLDNHTGLMWENKTDDGGLHDKDNKYTWYNPDANTNGGDAGNQNNGQNTYDFVNAVNTQGWCGYKDWRLPNIEELITILHYGTSRPYVDPTYFKNSIGNFYISSTPSVESHSAWGVQFNNLQVFGGIKRNNQYVRLVRASQ